MIKVLIVEDQFILQKTLEEKLSFYSDVQVKFCARNGEETLGYLADHRTIDLVLMDIEMPVMNGIVATDIIKQKYPHIKVVMITVFDDDEKIFNAIKAGADSYLLKDSSAEKIYEALTETLNGGAVMSPSIAMKTLKLLQNPFPVDPHPTSVELSERELEILTQLSKGLKNKAIADNLFISSATVKKHIENIYKKLQAHNRLEVVMKARQNKLL